MNNGGRYLSLTRHNSSCSETAAVSIISIILAGIVPPLPAVRLLMKCPCCGLYSHRRLVGTRRGALQWQYRLNHRSCSTSQPSRKDLKLGSGKYLLSLQNEGLSETGISEIEKSV